MEINPIKWDWELMVFLNNLSPDVLDPFWSFVTYTKHWIPFFILLIALFFYKSPAKKGGLGLSFVLACVGLTHLITDFTKSLVMRSRPNTEEALSEVIKVLYEPSHFSFFSGHASTSFAATVFIFLSLKSKYRCLSLIFIWPILFSSSRIFVGVHFPSDVIVGGVVGTILAILFYEFYNFALHKLVHVGN
jgi:undecaprenyl-diphosphatase